MPIMWKGSSALDLPKMENLTLTTPYGQICSNCRDRSSTFSSKCSRFQIIFPGLLDWTVNWGSGCPESADTQIKEHRWCDGQVCPDVGYEIMRSWSRRPEGVFVFYERDFCGLPMRRDERRVVGHSCCLEKGFFRRRRKKNPGGRELEESPGWVDLAESAKEGDLFGVERKER
ncbi:hypothetical protein TNCV_1939991 [Trichonephila clavipes]|nr:hypothetical protein TNCV_1939991 [Trichonephila clavipes]